VAMTKATKKKHRRKKRNVLVVPAPIPHPIIMLPEKHDEQTALRKLYDYLTQWFK
jgi:hypothetical protein